MTIARSQDQQSYAKVDLQFRCPTLYNVHPLLVLCILYKNGPYPHLAGRVQSFFTLLAPLGPLLFYPKKWKKIKHRTNDKCQNILLLQSSPLEQLNVKMCNVYLLSAFSSIYCTIIASSNFTRNNIDRRFHNHKLPPEVFDECLPWRPNNMSCIHVIQYPTLHKQHFYKISRGYLGAHYLPCSLATSDQYF